MIRLFVKLFDYFAKIAGLKTYEQRCAIKQLRSECRRLRREIDSYHTSHPFWNTNISELREHWVYLFRYNEAMDRLSYLEGKSPVGIDSIVSYPCENAGKIRNDC